MLNKNNKKGNTMTKKTKEELDKAYTAITIGFDEQTENHEYVDCPHIL